MSRHLSNRLSDQPNQNSHSTVRRYLTLLFLLLLPALAVIGIPNRSLRESSAAYDPQHVMSNAESLTFVAPVKSSDAVVGPALGNYPDITVNLGGETIVTPDAAPTSVTSINVASSTNFKGTFAADPATGIVRVTNAHPAGTYTVTIRGFDSVGVNTTKTFTLTVPTGTACVGNSVFFEDPYSIGPGADFFNVVIGDFNNDGKQDIASIINSTDKVSIRLGDGAGGFAGTTEVGVGSWPVSIAVGDFNNDGKQDFATSNRSSNTVSIRLGDGTGGFAGTTEVGVGSAPYSIAVGDFNNDGKQDIAIVNLGSRTVSIRLGDGTGGFTVKPNVSNLIYPTSIALGDFNNDGKQDIAVADEDTNGDFVRIQLGDGAGGFNGTTVVDVAPGLQSIAVGDFNNDGKQDFATANYSSNTVSIRLGDGAGRFTGTADIKVGGSYSVQSIVIGDFNKDGKQDIATGYNSQVRILLGDGTGGFTGTADFNAGASAGSTAGPNLAIGDFNNDGKQDLVANGTQILMATCSARPTIAGGDLQQQRGGAASNWQVATVTDDGGNGNVSVTVASANPSNGVTISNIVNTGGAVTADVVASCSASNATFTLQASDGKSTATAALTVTVTANTLTYSNLQSVVVNGALNVTPATAIYTGTITGYAVQSVVPPLVTAPTVDASGVVSITDAQPVGTHVITIGMTDCGKTQYAQFMLYVGASEVTCLTQVVTTNADNGAGSLREAIIEACDGATITFDMSQVTSPITLTSGELAINKNLTIFGPGANVLTVQRIDADATRFRIFNITSGTVNISGLTITKGFTPDPIRGSVGGFGGGVLNSGTLTISNSTISGNRTGGEVIGPICNAIGGSGGGISNSGTLIISNSTISGNQTGRGGAVCGDGSVASGSEGSGGSGGGISNSGTLTINNSLISGNQGGGGGPSVGAMAGGPGGGGGGIFNSGPLTISNSTISDNQTGSGGICGGPAFIPGPSGSGGSGGGISNSGPLTISNSTISGNQTGKGGGGVTA